MLKDFQASYFTPIYLNFICILTSPSTRLENLNPTATQTAQKYCQEVKKVINHGELGARDLFWSYCHVIPNETSQKANMVNLVNLVMFHVPRTLRKMVWTKIWFSKQLSK